MTFQVLYVSRVVATIWPQRSPRCHVRFCMQNTNQAASMGFVAQLAPERAGLQGEHYFHELGLQRGACSATQLAPTCAGLQREHSF